MDEYIEREAAIERLKKNLYASNPGSFSYLCFQDAINSVQEIPAADVEPVQEWIPVTERLPKCEGSYIVFTERGSIYASHFYTEKRFASGYVREAQWSQRGTVKVTHWMPLPEPPKGE